jgi:hypothetical protein
LPSFKKNDGHAIGYTSIFFGIGVRLYGIVFIYDTIQITTKILSN